MSDTITAYRFFQKKWAEAAFGGEGARLYGGRWNSKGKACVYLSSSISLATLEVMVHLQNYKALEHYLMFEVTLQKSQIINLSSSSIPTDWQDDPAPASTANIGDEWLGVLVSPALRVPSSVVPQEHNYLLNPAHQDFKGIIATAIKVNYRPDERLKLKS